jgi:hypothetical protein
MEAVAMPILKRVLDYIRDWFERNFSFKGVALLFTWIAAWVPDAFGRVDFWSRHIGWVWRHIYTHSSLSVAVVCGVLIWLDHRRVIAKRGPQPHDSKTVKGRTLRLRDDLQKLLDEAVTKWPEHVQGKTILPHDDSILTNALARGSYIQHTFALRFASQAEVIYHECALAGTQNDSFWVSLNPGVANASKLEN